ncbi:hypothetical protein RZS08_66285, partial [Arthrospira platensis SPKY1]|nr:hypothetical protein [Arthrospira platensis SPKY1]
QHRVGLQAPLPLRVHGVGPVQIHRAGNVTATGGALVLPAEFARRAGIQQRQVGLAEPLQNIVPVGDRRRVSEAGPIVAPRRLAEQRFQRSASRVPGVDATIE